MFSVLLIMWLPRHQPGGALKERNMKFKEFKEKVNAIPEEAGEFDVIFGASGEEGLFDVSDVFQTYFEGEVPEGFTKDFIAIWSGEEK